MTNGRSYLSLPTSPFIIKPPVNNKYEHQMIATFLAPSCLPPLYATTWEARYHNMSEGRHRLFSCIIYTVWGLLQKWNQEPYKNWNAFLESFEFCTLYDGAHITPPTQTYNLQWFMNSTRESYYTKKKVHLRKSQINLLAATCALGDVVSVTLMLFSRCCPRTSPPQFVVSFAGMVLRDAYCLSWHSIQCSSKNYSYQTYLRCD